MHTFSTYVYIIYIITDQIYTPLQRIADMIRKSEFNSSFTSFKSLSTTGPNSYLHSGVALNLVLMDCVAIQHALENFIIIRHFLESRAEHHNLSSANAEHQAGLYVDQVAQLINLVRDFPCTFFNRNGQLMLASLQQGRGSVVKFLILFLEHITSLNRNLIHQILYKKPTHVRKVYVDQITERVEIKRLMKRTMLHFSSNIFATSACKATLLREYGGCSSL